MAKLGQPNEYFGARFFSLVLKVANYWVELKYGLMNCQHAITASREIFLLEDNPHASRTVPFASKAIGHPLAKYAALVMSGKTLQDLQFTKEVIPKHVSIKEALLPFEKFQGADVILGPELITTVAGALATGEAIKSLKNSKIEMSALQDYFNIDNEKERRSTLQSIT